MLVAGREFSEDIIERIRVRVRSDSSVTRSSLSREVCTWLDWRAADGRLKQMNCRVALLKLARCGVLALPPARSVSFARPPRAEGLAEPGAIVQMTLAELGPVELVPVDGEQVALSRQWWAMLQAHHPLGASALCGAQLRYLVSSGAGVLGALSFSAAAWRLAARDQWIGWDDATRQAGLGKVVANSRFLILPTVKVANLASHILSLAALRIVGDWQARYGIAPVLLESFVDSTRYRGTCYRAANWTLLGHTRGRGRQDRTRTAAGTVKDIWVYALRPDWRAGLCAGAVAPRAKRPEPVDWAAEEFGGCALPDARLQGRLLSLARDFYARPTASVPQACSSRAATKAAYRFLEHDHTTMQTLLQPHYGATEARVSKESIVLAVQDTTSLDYTTHRATEGLGPIAAWAQGPQGLQLHSTLAFNEHGTPLGFLDVQCWARDAQAFGKKAKRHQLPIEEKESYKWLKSYRAVAAVQARLPNTTLVSVGDREADLYELFAEAAKHRGGPQLLVRARHDRQLQHEQARLWQALQGQPVAGMQELQLPRQGSRAARAAHLAIRFAPVSLLAPTGHQGAPAIVVWAVFAQEQAAPPGAKALEWLLLSTLPVTSVEQALERLMWYARRWGIEVLHRTLKSGCRIEQRQLGRADRLEACLAIDLVVAWRIYYLNKLGRELPEAACTLYFEEAQWKALMVFTTHNRVAPKQPPTLRDAIHRVAALGGFLGRKGDGEPGTQTLWLGLQRLDDIVAMWQVMTDATQRTVSSAIDSG
jgi:hypothetical protein